MSEPLLNTPATLKGAKRIAVLSNCQARGIGAAMVAARPGLCVESFIPASFQRRYADHPGSIYHDFDYLVASPKFDPSLPSNFDRSGIVRIPLIVFEAYHPDLIFVHRKSGGYLPSVIGNLHSALGLAAFMRGLSIEAALDLFNARVYERLGYFDLWQPSKSQLFEHAHAADFDIERYFYTWCRHDAFMYTVNHPRAICLSDIAASVLERIGCPATAEVAVFDFLAAGAHPVYPEIGERYGIEGSYRFATRAEGMPLHLNDLIARSFEIYRSVDIADLVPVSPRFRSILNALPA
jgi:hypothetical protein